MIRTTIYLTEELHQSLKEQAVKLKMSMGGVIQEALVASMYIVEGNKITNPKEDTKKAMEKYLPPKGLCKHNNMKGLCKFSECNIIKT